jgi:hypothetical protein
LIRVIVEAPTLRRDSTAYALSDYVDDLEELRPYLRLVRMD